MCPFKILLGFGHEKRTTQKCTLTSKKYRGLAKSLECPSWCSGLAAALGIPAQQSMSEHIFSGIHIKMHQRGAKMLLCVICDGSATWSTFPDEYSGSAENHKRHRMPLESSLTFRRFQHNLQTISCYFLDVT